MYYNDKRQKISVRLTEEEWDFILTLCGETGKRPSDMVRYCIDNVAISYAIARDEFERSGEDGIDCKADFYN